MSIEEEIKLLEKKLELLKKKRALEIEIAELETPYVPTYPMYPIYPTYPSNPNWPNSPTWYTLTTSLDGDIPSRMKEVDPTIRNLMMEDSCLFIS